MQKFARTLFRLVLSLAMSGLFVWLSLRHTDVRKVAQAILAVPIGWLAAYLTILLCIHLIRTVRWGILLEPLGEVPFRRLNSASAVGLMLLLLLPLRLGEFARPLLIARPPEGQGGRISRTGALASIVVERVVDGLFMGLVGVFCLHQLGARATGAHAADVRRASWVITALFLGLCVALLIAFFSRALSLRILRALLKPLPARTADRAVGLLDTFISALHLGSGWKAVGFFLLTALYWSLAAFGLSILAAGFGLELSMLMAFTVLSVQVVGVMLPAGPGMIGVLQYFTQVGLSLFFVDALSSVSAAAYANTVWLMQFGQQVLLGLAFLLAGHVSLQGLLPGSTPTDDGLAAPSPAATEADRPPPASLDGEGARG